MKSWNIFHLSSFSVHCTWVSFCSLNKEIICTPVHSDPYWITVNLCTSFMLQIKSVFWSLCVAEMEQGKAKGKGKQHGFVRSSHLWQTLGGGSEVQAHHTIHSFWSFEGEYLFWTFYSLNGLTEWIKWVDYLMYFLKISSLCYEFFTG